MVAGGIAALVLPGPGLLMLFGGMALLSQRYEWAERRLEPIRLRALLGAAEGVETWPRIIASCLGGLFVLACGILWTINPPAPHWWPFEASLWLLGKQWAGVTLILSSLIAFALIVYSYRRFHGKPEAVAELRGDISEADVDLSEYREEHHHPERSDR